MDLLRVWNFTGRIRTLAIHIKSMNLFVYLFPELIYLFILS